MASILDILIEILKIDCGVAQCYYPNEIEAMFYLFFFPTIFIILFIYILTNFIFRGSGKIKGLRLLISIGAYAFIIFEVWFTSVVSISHLWWILTIILVGLFAFVRFLFTGGREEKGALPAPGGDFSDRLKGKFREEFLKRTGLETRQEEIERKEEEARRRVLAKYEDKGWDGLSEGEKAIWLAAHGVSAGDKADFDKLHNALTKSKKK